MVITIYIKDDKETKIVQYTVLTLDGWNKINCMWVVKWTTQAEVTKVSSTLEAFLGHQYPDA